MKLHNASPYPALLEMGSTTDHEQLGCVACRVSYRWDDAGTLTPLPAEEMWPVARAPEYLGEVCLLPDADFRRLGIDVLVFGDALAPGGQAVTHMQVGVASGRFVRQYDVWGHRFWQRRAGKDGAWQASSPEPFVRMPLDNSQAFGGSARLGEHDVPWHMNPAGKGFMLDARQAQDAPLPNLERSDQPMRTPTDTPVPACFFKPAGGLLLPADGPDSWHELTRQDPMRMARVMARQSFQQAPPDFVCPRGWLGPRLTLKGFDTRGLLHIALPPEEASLDQGPVVQVEVGGLRSWFPLRIVSLIALVAERTLVVGFAASFRYRMNPGDKRHAELHWCGASSFALEASA